MFTTDGTATLPEKRILKGALLLAEPVFDTGNKRITLLDLQRVRGTVRAWSPVVPMVCPDLRALDVFHLSAGSQWVVPKEGRDPEESWQELWGAFEFWRLLASRPEESVTRFTVGLA